MYRCILMIYLGYHSAEFEVRWLFYPFLTSFLFIEYLTLI